MLFRSLGNLGVGAKALGVGTADLGSLGVGEPSLVVDDRALGVDAKQAIFSYKGTFRVSRDQSAK